MFLRPVDASGDLLPVLSSSGLLSGPEAVARRVQYRLSLLRRAWWENPENARFTVSGRRFSYSCTVRTEEGTAEVSEEGICRDEKAGAAAPAGDYYLPVFRAVSCAVKQNPCA